jgi:transposase InsO family protein
MREHGIEGVRNGKTQHTTIPDLTPVPAPDLVQRNFSADRPDKLWLADFTYIRTGEGWSYLAVVLDVHTRRVVGWRLGRVTCVNPWSPMRSRWRWSAARNMRREEE